MGNKYAKVLYAFAAVAFALIGSFFAHRTSYFGINFAYVLTYYALYKFAIIELIECAVAACWATLETANDIQSGEVPLTYSDEREIGASSRAILNSDLFRRRMAEFGED